VVEALRRHHDEGWPIPEPRTRQNGLTGRDRPIDIETYTSGAYGDLFRLGSDTSGLKESFFDTAPGPFVPPDASTPGYAHDEFPVHREPFTNTNAAIAEAGPSADCSPPESAEDALTRQIQAELRMRCGRQRRRVIEGLQVHVAGDIALIICATFADLDIVQRELIGALQRILGSLGAPSQLVFTTRAGWEARERDAGNARSRPHLSYGVPAPR
jgi:hypothetical protein